MNDISSQIQNLVDDFAHQIAALAQRAAISALEGALGGSKASHDTIAARNGTGRHSGRGKGAKRTPAELEALEAKFVGFVAKHSGLRIEQINKELGTTTADLALPIRKLVASGRIKTKGKKRSTTYSGVEGAPARGWKTAGRRKKS